MRSAEEILNASGFDFERFKLTHEYSANNILEAMQEYAQQFKGQSTGYNQGPEEARKEAEEVFGGLRNLIKDDSIYQWYLELIIQYKLNK